MAIKPLVNIWGWGNILVRYYFSRSQRKNSNQKNEEGGILCEELIQKVF